MEGRRRPLLIKRPWYQCCRKLNKETLVIIAIVVISVAIGVWNSQHSERAVTNIVHFKDLTWEEDTSFSEAINNVLLSLPTTWTNLHLHKTCCMLLPAFLLVMLGMKNLRRFIDIMCKIVDGFIYRRKNYLANSLLLVVFIAFMTTAYIYNAMFYMACGGLTRYLLRFSVAEDTQTLLFQRDDRSSKFQGDVAPYFTVNVTRYNMEDAVMICRFGVTVKDDVPRVLNSFRWIKDNKIKIKETERIRINTTASTLPAHSDSVWIIESVLHIAFIDEADYGKYSCKYSRTEQEILMPYEMIPGIEDKEVSSLDHGLIPYNPPKQTIKYCRQVTVETFSIFHLQKQVMPLLEIKIPPGGLFIEYVPYWSFADPGGIIINETVWGKDNVDCCWLPARLYMFFFGERDLVWRLKTELGGRQRYLIRHQCVCVEDFALKNFTFTRTYYDSSTERQQAVKVSLPQRFVMIPRNYESLYGSFTPEDISSLLSDNYTSCTNTSDTSPVCKRLKLMTDASGESMQHHLFYHISNYCAPRFIITFVAIFIYLRVLFNCIVIPVAKACTDPSLNQHPRQNYDYDMYITYNENDRYESELAKYLKECLDVTVCSVFDPWSDIPPGYPVLDELQRAIGNSKRFCIIISEESANDGEKILEFTAIKQTLADRKAAGTETEDCTFVIQIGDCDSDGFLIPGTVIVSQSNRQNKTIEESVLHTFTKWAKIKLSLFHLLKIHELSILTSVIITAVGFVIVACLHRSIAHSIYKMYSLSNQHRNMAYTVEL